jgi:hypothetical protein
MADGVHEARGRGADSGPPCGDLPEGRNAAVGGTGAATFILHVGRHKTATSALQAFLAANAGLLAQEFGILYPETGRNPRRCYHHPVFETAVERGDPLDPQVVAAIVEEARRQSCSTILLSSEVLGRHDVPCEQLAKVRDSFAPHRVVIVVYLRRQDTFLPSIYAEWVKKGLIAAPTTIRDIDPLLDHCDFVERYHRVFGRAAVVVRSYDAAARRGIFDDFLGSIGVARIDGFRYPAARVNERLPWRYIALLRLANRRRWQRRLVADRRVRAAALWLYRRFPGFMDTPEPLSASERRSLLERFEERNAALWAENSTRP